MFNRSKLATDVIVLTSHDTRHSRKPYVVVTLISKMESNYFWLPRSELSLCRYSDRHPELGILQRGVRGRVGERLGVCGTRQSGMALPALFYDSAAELQFYDC